MKILNEAELISVNGGLTDNWETNLDRYIRYDKSLGITKEAFVTDLKRRWTCSKLDIENEEELAVVLNYIDQNWDSL